MGFMKFFLTVIALVLLFHASYSQTTGDYRNTSTSSSDWSDVTAWERWNGTQWLTATVAQGYPGQNASPNLVTILAFSVMNLDVSPAFKLTNFTVGSFSVVTTTGNPNFNVGNLIVAGVAALNFGGNGNLDVTGTSTITGFFIDSNDTGTTTMTGLVTVTGGWTSTTVVTAGRLIFKGGITNDATFNAGSASFLTNDQTIAGTGTCNFSSAVTVTTVTVTNNGTVSISGTLVGTGTWTQGTNSTLSFSGTTNSVTVFNASNTGNTVNYNANAAQNIRNSSASTYYNLTITSTANNIKTLQANTTINGAVLIQNTAILSCGGFDISLKGNWTNTSTNADPLQNTNLITLSGTAAQTINNSGNANGTVFNNLTFNNSFTTPPQITINDNSSVTGTLTMTSGVVSLSTATFTIGTSAASVGALSHAQTSANGWFYGGSLIRYIATVAVTGLNIADLSLTGFFPVGSSSYYRPFYLSNPTPALPITVGGTVTVTHNGAATVSTVSVNDPTAATKIVRRQDSNWVVSTSGITAAATSFKLHTGGNGLGYVGITSGTTTDLRIMLANSIVGTAGTNSGTVTLPVVQRTGLSLANLANTFYVGSIDATNSPLPITLSSFKAELTANDVVSLKWRTVQEISNDYFTVERSADGEQFVALKRIEGSGTTKETRFYQTEDSYPIIGHSYYRLKQTDFDGKISYSGIQHINYEGPSSPVMLVYPTPTETRRITIHLKGVENTDAIPVYLFNQQGLKVYEFIIQQTSEGFIKNELDLNGIVSPGLYIIKAGPNLQMTRKIVVN
jgi:hypothetical protein